MRAKITNIIFTLIAFTLLISLITGCEQPAKKAVEVQTGDQWYMRIVAEVPSKNLKDRGTVLGKLETSSDGYDKHDLVELDPQSFGGSYLTVVFPHSEWAESGDYGTDYHGVSSDEQEDSWDFSVKTDDVNSEVTLWWDGVFLLTSNSNGSYTEKQDLSAPLLDNMWLVDNKTGSEHKAIVDDNLQRYIFSMDGETERSFSWIIDYSGVRLANYTAPEIQTKTLTKSYKKVLVKSVSADSELGTPPGIK